MIVCLFDQSTGDDGTNASLTQSLILSRLLLLSFVLLTSERDFRLGGWMRCMHV
jgi:hypothetical protein